MKLLAVINPRAGSGRAGRLRARVDRAFRSRGARVDWHESDGPEAATHFTARADLVRYDAIVAAGGDGTLFEVLNGLYRREPRDRIPLAVVPLGTGNAFARDLGLGPGDWERGTDIAVNGATRRVDVVRAELPGDSFHFLNVSGAGLVAEAGRWAERVKWTGSASYALGAVMAVAAMEPQAFAIEIDGHEIREDCLLVEVSNSRYTGTHFMIAPSAELDDGRMVVTWVRAASRRRLLGLLPRLYSGSHVEAPEVEVRKARHVRIHAPTGLGLSTDGELRGATPVEFTCLPRDLALRAPQ